MKVLIRSIEWFILLFIIFVLKCGQSVNSDIEHLNNSSRQQRDYDHGDYHVKCKHSNTGLFSFFAIPILLGNVMITFMGMIGITINITVNNTAVNNTNNNTNNNNNNNNNGGSGGSTSTSTGTGNNNNNNNNNGKRKRSTLEGGVSNLLEQIKAQDLHQDFEMFRDLSDPASVSKNFIAAYNKELTSSLSVNDIPKAPSHPGVHQSPVYDEVVVDFIESLHQKYLQLMDQCRSQKAETFSDCNVWMAKEDKTREDFYLELEKNVF